MNQALSILNKQKKKLQLILNTKLQHLKMPIKTEKSEFFVAFVSKATKKQQKLKVTRN